MTGLIVDADGTATCRWHGGLADYRRYHDTEWGRPTKDERYLFEKLCLEGFQSGLSWYTILKKRPNFRAAFADFDAATLAGWGEAEIGRLLQDAGIVRHRGKIEAVLNNARRCLELRAEAGSLGAFVWRFEPVAAAGADGLDHAPLSVPGKTAESTELSKALRKRGWSFVGPTTVYAFMQSCGLVNDHLAGCACRDACSAARAAFIPPT